MSIEMKSVLTTLDLVMQNKVDPETVLEEDEIEETLTINEDGELLSELHPHPELSKLKPGPRFREYYASKPSAEGDPEGWSRRGAERDEAGMDDWYASNASKQFRDNVVAQGNIDNYKWLDADVLAQFDDYRSDALAKPKLEKKKRTLGDKLKDVPGFYWDSIKDAGGSLYNAYASQGVKDYASRRKAAYNELMRDDISLEEFTDSANFLLEDYALQEKVLKIEDIISNSQISEIKRLSGQVITEAPMTAQHYTAVADIIASIANPNVRKAVMVKFTNDLESKYDNFQRERFINYIMSAAQAQPVEEPQEPAQLPTGQSETETEGMIQTPDKGTQVVSKDSEEYRKAEAGEDGYGLAEST